MAVIFWIGCSGLALLRYYGFYPSYATFDQGIFNQVFWNSLHGRWFQSSLSSTEAIAVAQGALPDVSYHRLAQHFTPSLLLWLPFYALWPSPAGLSVIQVTLVAIAGFILYALARCYHAPPLAMFITLSYYVAGAVIGPTLANFHDFCQVPLFLFGLFLVLEKRQWAWFVGLSGLTLLVREDAGIMLFSLGGYLIVSRRYPRLGAGLCLGSLAYILLLTNLVMPRFSADISQRFMVEEFGAFIQDQEASTLEVLWAILSNPWQLIVQLVTPIGLTIRYLLAQWLPLVFVPAISPSAWLLAGFPLLKLLLQQNPSALAIDRRFALSLVPGLFYGAILWWACHSDRFTPKFRRVWAGCLLLSLVLTLTANPNRALSVVIPDSIQPWVYTSPARQWEHSQVIRSFLSQIPEEASVSATSFIVPHVSSRREVLRFPEVRFLNDQGKAVQVKYAIADLWQFQQYQTVFPWEQEQFQRSMAGITRLLESDRYGLLDFQDGVALLQRRMPSNPAALERWHRYQSESNLVS